MIEKVHALAEMKLAGMNIQVWLDKMYQKYGKEQFDMAIICSGYGKLLGVK